MAVTTKRRTPADGPGSPPPIAATGALTRSSVGVPRRRRPGLLAAGVVLAVLGALAALWMVNAAGQRVPVLVLARTVPVGAAVADADLAVTDLSAGPGIVAVEAGRRSEVVGQVARTELVAGSLLSPDQLAPAGLLEAGQVLVVIALPPSRMPATGLAPGTPILVVSTPPTDADATAASAPASIAATVVRVGTPDLNGLTPVDVALPAGDGPALAARAATGRIAVVVRPTGR